MNIVSKRFATLLLILLSFQLNAQVQPTEEADLVVEDKQAEQPASTAQETIAASKSTTQDAYSYVEEKARKYILEKRRKFRAQNKQVFIHSGTAAIKLKPTEAGWADARVLAYAEAQQKARESLLKQLDNNVKTNTIRSAFKTDRLPEFTPEEIQEQSKFEAILSKVVALTDATLDTKLEELGVDPSEYNAAPPSKRKKILENSITRNVITTSRANITGTQIMKSFEKTDADGRTAVSVVIATSNKKKNLLASLRKSKGNIEPSPEKAKNSVEDYLEMHRDNLMYQIGTKLHWDEKGYPVLLSFGMSGNSCNLADYEECISNREFSYMDAELNAWAHISEAYNLSGSIDSKSSATSSQTTTATVTLRDDKNTDLQKDPVAQVIKEINATSKMTSSVKGLTGIQEATRWSVKHPVTNREMNGVVLVWHPLAEQETRAFKENKDNRKKSAGAKITSRATAGESLEADDEDF